MKPYRYRAICALLLTGVALNHIISQSSFLVGSYLYRTLVVDAATGTTSTTPVLAPVPGGLSLQEITQDALLRLNQSSAWNLAGISSTEEIDEKAVLRAWSPCLSALRVKPKKKKFTAVVLGGSLSARPSDNCSITSTSTGTGDPEDGRYTNILQHNLRQQGMDATIHNMAQGSTTSTLSGMLMDQLIDPNDDIDLLIWEHAINDYVPYNKNTAAEMLEFWLARVKNIYTKHSKNKPPPPILIMYLWKSGVGGVHKDDILRNGAGYNQNLNGPNQDHKKCLEVIDRYRYQHNFNIQLLHVANIIDRHNLAADRLRFVDDNHHPACAASHLFADVLQYILLMNANVDSANTNTTNCEESTIRIPTGSDTQEKISASLITAGSKNTNATLLELLLDPGTTISTLTQWVPALDNRHQSLIALESVEKSSDHFGATLLGRSDRKVSYKVPTCSETTSSSARTKTKLQFTLTSFEWQWLCVAFRGQHILATVAGGETVPLKGEGLTVAKLGGPVNDHTQKHNFDWFNLRDQTSLEVSFCDNATEAQRLHVEDGNNETIIWSWIHLLTGVKA